MARTPKKTKRATSDERRATKKPSERDLRTAGFECADLAAAGERLGVVDLEAVLKRSKRLATAWDRGQLLRRVQDVASTTLVVPERADKLLGLAKGTFLKVYQTDRIVRELWDRGRYEIQIEIDRSLVARIKEGDVKAIAAVEAVHQLFGHGPKPETSANLARLTPTELETATAIKRAQWDRWTKENGCPRNADGTFCLAAVVDWLRKWERDKATGGREAVGLNPMQAQKARMYQLQADEAEGRLIDRATIVRMFRERAARMVQILGESRAEEWAQSHEGQTAAQLKDLYLAAFRRVREIYTEFPAEVPMPEAAKEKIEEGIQMLLATEGTENTEKGTADGRR